MGNVMSYRGSPTFLGVYETYKDLCKGYGGYGWNSETTKRYDIYVHDVIVPHLVNHDIKSIAQYTEEDFKKAIEWIEQDQNEKIEPKDKMAEDEASDYAATLKKVRFLIRAVVYAAATMSLCRKSLYQNLEKDDWHSCNPSSAGKAVRPENQRVAVPQSMTEKMEVEFYKHLSQYLKKDEEGVFAGLFLMAAVGERNGEACGANFAFVQEMVDYPGNYCLVVPQSMKADSGELQLGGKSVNAFRLIPLPDCAIRILAEIFEKRCKRRRGPVDLEKEKSLPIACRHQTHNRCRARDLSEAAKELFQLIGMQEEELIEMGLQLFEEQASAEEQGNEDAFHEIEKEPTAYLLRRHVATLLAILGLEKREICLIMGHSLDEGKGARRNYLADENTLMQIKRKLDQRAIFNEILTKRFFQLCPGDSFTYTGSQTIHISVPLKDLKAFTLNADSIEPYDTLRIQANIKSLQGRVKVHFKSTTIEQTGEVPKTIDCLREYREKYMDAGANEILKEYWKKE